VGNERHGNAADPRKSSAPCSTSSSRTATGPPIFKRMYPHESALDEREDNLRRRGGAASRVSAPVRCHRDGLARRLVRGMQARDTGGRSPWPGGHGTIGRIINGIGDPRRQWRARPATKRYPIHREPPDDSSSKRPRGRRSRTGIKVRRPARASARGGQDRPFRRRRRRQDRVHPGAQSNTVAKQKRRRLGIAASATAHARGNDLWLEMKEFGGHGKDRVVYGR